MRRVAGLSVVLVLVLVAALSAQQRHPVSGRVIAPVMGVGGAAWLERPEREYGRGAVEARWTRSELEPGDGGGRHRRGLGLLHRPAWRSEWDRPGSVFATDIQPGMLDLLKRRVHSRRPRQRDDRAGRAGRSRAAGQDSIDLRIMVDVYHELAAAAGVRLQRLKTAFKPDGRLVLLEFRKEDPRVPILEVHKMSVSRGEAGAGGRGLRASTR